MHKAIFITVRTGSTRLPNKALLKIKGKPTIEHLINRVKQTQLVDNIVLCTTTLPEDDILCDIADKHGILHYRGSVKDKLERWRGACEEFSIDFFATADGDDLFCDPELLELAFRQCETSDVDFIHGDELICGSFTYGIKTSALRKVCEIKNTEDTEMMWTYFKDTKLFNVKSLQQVPKKYKRKDIRMTLDYEDDFKFFKKIIEYFGDKKFGLANILSYIDANPEIKDINYYLEEKWKNNQIKKTKLVLK
mgnify:CR=1 FL=1